ncbi:MAG: pyrroline-5-carboxylate reductase [Acholeplasmatales bacterium]|nr:pyrroline-5-carboxylate reductase [Acholeplasmatales bacterium]
MIGIVGLGKIGNYVLSGIIDKNLYSKDDVLLGLRRIEAKKEYEEKGYLTTLDLNTLFLKCNVIVLSVKPQNYDTIISYSRNIDFKNKCIISTIAGIDLETIQGDFKNGSIYRVMPNIGAALGKSVTTLCYTEKDELFETAKKVFETIGSVVEVNEYTLDKSVPLNGSMPAFIYMFIKDFIDVSVKNGLDYETSKNLILDTIVSSVEYYKESDKKINDLIIDVCSKGGITIAGLNEMYKNGFDDSIRACYQACLKRSDELKYKK